MSMGCCCKFGLLKEEAQYDPYPLRSKHHPNSVLPTPPMALRFLSQVPVMSPFQSSAKSGNQTSSVRIHPPRVIHLTKKSKNNRKAPLLASIKAVDEEKGEPVELSELGAEIKKEKEGGADLFSGVAEEVREIEWPVFGKVLGTTGVVLGVIAGSSLVLLTVNALLAELSDRVFAGKGVQDFFG